MMIKSDIVKMEKLKWFADLISHLIGKIFQRVNYFFPPKVWLKNSFTSRWHKLHFSTQNQTLLMEKKKKKLKTLLGSEIIIPYLLFHFLKLWYNPRLTKILKIL